MSKYFKRQLSVNYAKQNKWIMVYCFLNKYYNLAEFKNN